MKTWTSLRGSPASAVSWAMNWPKKGQPAAAVAAVAQPARRAEREQRAGVAVERRQVGERAPVAALDRRDRRVDRTIGCQAVVADRMGQGGHGARSLSRRVGASALRAGACRQGLNGSRPNSCAKSAAATRRPMRSR
jgi:hypothetical protein